mgnify:FL=1
MSVPSILQNKPLRRPVDMNIQSEILYPIQFNQHSTRFVFDNKGILDSNSRINLAVSVNKLEEITTAPENSGTDAATVVLPTTVDAGLFKGQQVELTSGNITATGGTTTTAIFSSLTIVAVLVAGVKVGDQIQNTVAGRLNEVAMITAISVETDTITFEPIFANAVANTNTLKIYSSTVFEVETDAGATLSEVEDYYVNMYMRIGAGEGDGTTGAAGGITRGFITKYDTSTTPNQITIGPRMAGEFAYPYRLATQTDTLWVDDNKMKLLLNTTGDNKLLCIYNPLTIVLPAGLDEEEGYYNGWNLTAVGNITPDDKKTTVIKYYQTNAEALADTGNGFKMIDPPARTCFISKTFNAPNGGYSLIAGTGGVTAITLHKHEVFASSMFPISTGVASLIKRAVLTVGGREVSSLDSVGHFNTITNMLNSTEYREKILFHLQGVNDGMVFGKDTEGLDGFIKLAQGKAIDTVLTTMPDALKLGGTLLTTPRFSLPLSDLIPMLRGVKLPLFAINQEVSLLIEWAEDINGHRIVQETEAGSTYEKTTIHESECYLMTDYLYYEAEMDAVLNEINGNDWTLPYEDVITIDAQLPALAQQPVGNTPLNYTKTETDTLLYLGGKTVRNLLIQKQSGNIHMTGGIGNNRLEGIYNSRGFQRPETFNLMIDNKPFYDNDITLGGLQYQELSRCFDTHLQIPFARYSLANAVNDDYDLDRDTGGYISNIKFLDAPHGGSAVPQSRALEGNQNYFGINIGNPSGNGEVMSPLPLIFRHTTERKATNSEWDDPITYKFYATIKRGLGIRRGGMVVVSG